MTWNPAKSSWSGIKENEHEQKLFQRRSKQLRMCLLQKRNQDRSRYVRGLRRRALSFLLGEVQGRMEPEAGRLTRWCSPRRPLTSSTHNTSSGVGGRTEASSL